MFMVVFKILTDIQGKIIIMLESHSIILASLAYISYCVNIITLAVTFAHIGQLDNTIDKLTCYCGFVGLIGLDNQIGQIVVDFWYPNSDKNKLFKRVIADKNNKAAVSFVKYTFILFNLWALGFNTFLLHEDK